MQRRKPFTLASRLLAGQLILHFRHGDDLDERLSAGARHALAYALTAGLSVHASIQFAELFIRKAIAA